MGAAAAFLSQAERNKATTILQRCVKTDSSDLNPLKFARQRLSEASATPTLPLLI